MVRTMAGFALSALLLWWTLHDQDLARIGQDLARSHLALFALSIGVGYLTFPLRALRWRPILEASVERLPLGPLWRTTAIGTMVNNLFPLRMGEVARALALTRECPAVPLTTALSSLAVDRLFDALVVFALMFVAMLDPRFPDGARVAGRTVPELALGGLAAVVLLLAIGVLLARQPALVLGAVRTLADRMRPRSAEAIVRIVGNGVSGFAILRDGPRFVAVWWWTLAHWLLNALALALSFRAVGIDAPVSAALFLQGVLALGVAVPSSPGFFGVFELAATMGLEVYGVPKDLAVSWALGYHVLSFIPITITGAVYFARLGLSAESVRAARPTSPTPVLPTESP